MSSVRSDTFKNEMLKLRRGVSRLLHEDPMPRTRGEKDARKPLVEPPLTIRDVMQTGLTTVRPESQLGPAVSMMMEIIAIVLIEIRLKRKMDAHTNVGTLRTKIKIRWIAKMNKYLVCIDGVYSIEDEGSKQLEEYISSIGYITEIPHCHIYKYKGKEVHIRAIADSDVEATEIVIKQMELSRKYLHHSMMGGCKR